MPVIILKVGSDSEQVIRIGSDPVIIGRGPSSDIRLNDSGVSRSHAEISRQDGTWAVRDLGSSNGTLLNNTVLGTEKSSLSNGDIIRLGHASVLTFADEVATAMDDDQPGAPPMAEKIPDEAIEEEPLQLNEMLDLDEPPPASDEPIDRPADEDHTGGAHTVLEAPPPARPAPAPSVIVPVTGPQLEDIELEAIQSMEHAMAQIRTEVHKVIIGQDQVLDEVLTAMLSRG
ncbi:MAG: FHA domain-containing protein, partial [Planctomycetes bacterium]|nr:FHA domain-containing protein [Planctomycetota bacterium]